MHIFRLVRGGKKDYREAIRRLLAHRSVAKILFFLQARTPFFVLCEKDCKEWILRDARLEDDQGGQRDLFH